MFQRWVSALGIAALLVGGQARATTVIDQPVETMTRESLLVVRGKVTGARVGQDAGGPVTRTTVKVTSTLKGRPVDTITVWQRAGSDGENAVGIAGDAQFATGEEVVLFLEPHPSEAGAYVLLAMSAAKFTVEKVGRELVAVRQLSGLTFIRPPGSHPPDQRSAATPAARLPLNDLLRRVQSAARR